jgi:hypothetical protein
MRPKVNKSIAIIGEGETEWFYFDALRVSSRYSFKMAPDFPCHSDIEHILKLAERYKNEGYDFVVCLIDMDRIRQNPTEWKKYQKHKTERKYKHIIFIETYPCTEFWFLLHFVPNLSTRLYRSYEDLLPELQKYMPGYEKTKRYFKQTDLYSFLNKHGDISRAMKNSEKLCELSKANPEDESSYSEIYKVIKLLDDLEPMKSPVL